MNQITITRAQADDILKHQINSDVWGELVNNEVFFYTYQYMFSRVFSTMLPSEQVKQDFANGTYSLSDDLNNLYSTYKEIKDDKIVIEGEAFGTIIKDMSKYIPIEGSNTYLIYANDYYKHMANEAKQKENRKEVIPQKTYIMYDESTDLYKIGKSVDIQFREKTLAGQIPRIKTILYCKSDIERTLHIKYSCNRVRGEWFKLSSDDILDIIKEFKFISNN